MRIKENIHCDKCDKEVEEKVQTFQEKMILKKIALSHEDALVQLYHNLDKQFHPTHYIKFRIYSR